MLAYADFAMNIRNINLGSERAETYRSNGVSDTARTTPVKGTQHANEIKSAIQDKVEISDAARAALSKQIGARPRSTSRRRRCTGLPS
jgi:hypothetical protein